MKKLLGIMALSALAASGFAQGTVTVWNQTGLVKQWTSAADSTPISVAKNGGFVQLIAASAGTALANPLFTTVASGVQANYSSLAGFLAANTGWAAASGTAGTAPVAIALGAGLFSGGTFTIGNIGAGANAEYLAIGWTGAFASIDQAIAAAGTGVMGGASAIYTTATADPGASPPPTPISMRLTFGGQTLAPIVLVPEPSTFALAGLGAAALLIFRRRK